MQCIPDTTNAQLVNYWWDFDRNRLDWMKDRIVGWQIKDLELDQPFAHPICCDNIADNWFIEFGNGVCVNPHPSDNWTATNFEAAVDIQTKKEIEKGNNRRQKGSDL